MPTQIFISHITEDAAVATRLKLQLMEDFLDQFTVFQSSDTESIAAGENWLSSTSKAIRGSSLFIILCSPIAITRPWVNFEAGAAWMRDLPLIPACFEGLRRETCLCPFLLIKGWSLMTYRDCSGCTAGLQRPSAAALRRGITPRWQPNSALYLNQPRTALILQDREMTWQSGRD
jgi:TIR domain